MRASEVRDMTGEEIREKARELDEELFRLRLRRGTGQLEDPMQIRKVRRDVARVKTVQHERAHAVHPERS